MREIRRRRPPSPALPKATCPALVCPILDRWNSHLDAHVTQKYCLPSYTNQGRTTITPGKQYAQAQALPHSGLHERCGLAEQDGEFLGGCANAAALGVNLIGEPKRAPQRAAPRWRRASASGGGNPRSSDPGARADDARIARPLCDRVVAGGTGWSLTTASNADRNGGVPGRRAEHFRRKAGLRSRRSERRIQHPRASTNLPTAGSSSSPAGESFVCRPIGHVLPRNRTIL
jgi:hypothetical protein